MKGTTDSVEVLAAKGYEVGERGRHVLEVGVTVEKIECARLSEKATESSKSNYKLNIALAEKRRRPEGVVMSFTLEFTGSPALAKISVSGSALLTGSEPDLREAMASEDKTPPRVVEVIYEKIYGLVYILAGSMKVPSPMPNLLKKNQ